MEKQEKQAEQQPEQKNVQLTVDNLFEFMFVFTKKGIDAKVFDEQYENEVKQCFEYFSGAEFPLITENALNIVVKGYNIIQEKGKYSLMDAFNVVQLVSFIQSNLEKVKEKIKLNKEQKDKGKGKLTEETNKTENNVTKTQEKGTQTEQKDSTEEDDLSELTEPIPLKGKIVNI